VKLLNKGADMREIEFRGKRKDTGEWVYGGYMNNICHNTVGIWTEQDDGTSYGHEIIPETVGQYTGLKDRNGVKIFEGDIVQFTYWWFDGHESDSILPGEIIYLPGVMSFGLRGVKNADWIRHTGGEEGTSYTVPFAFLTFDEADFEVIGNIHDTPELLA
jgi:uncharacterized phage protein (TIGR01671 family)